MHNYGCHRYNLGISFGSIFLLFSYESSGGHIYSNWGKSLSPCLLMTALANQKCIHLVLVAKDSFVSLVTNVNNKNIV